MYTLEKSSPSNVVDSHPKSPYALSAIDKEDLPVGRQEQRIPFGEDRYRASNIMITHEHVAFLVREIWTRLEKSQPDANLNKANRYLVDQLQEYLPAFGRRLQRETTSPRRTQIAGLIEKTTLVDMSFNSELLKSWVDYADHIQVRSFLLNSKSFDWLVKTAESLLLLTNKRDTELHDITKDLKKHLKSSTSNKAEDSKYSDDYVVRFKIECDLVGFLHRQDYGTDVMSALAAAITITGKHDRAQALTCLEYMSMVWPYTGAKTVHALQSALNSGVDKWHTFEMSCFGRISLALSSFSMINVTAYGDETFMIELCEQLAWLASTLTETRLLTGPVYSSPQIYLRKSSSPGELRVVIVASQIRIANPAPPDTCWHGLFETPVIVFNFPVRLRPLRQVGLELSLHVLYTLAETRFATQYDGALILKGYCTMLLPTQCTYDSITWHFLQSKDNKRISYTSSRRYQADLENTKELTLQHLEHIHTRHFVGWTSNINRYLGTAAVEYNSIEWSGAKICKSGWAAENKLTISVTKIIGLSGSVIRGNRDKPEYVKFSNFSAQLDWIRSIWIVLYDTGTRRGWLVDGASALLHLVRTQLGTKPYAGANSTNNRAIFKVTDIKHPEPAGGPDAAYEALSSEENLMRIILREFDSYDEKEGLSSAQILEPGNTTGATSSNSEEKRGKKYKTVCVKDLVSHIWSTLEQIYDRQTELELGSASTSVPSGLGLCLEGYEFMDLISHKHKITRRTVKLHSNGAEWLKFTKTVDAITLFGQNFGDIYEPAQAENMCSPWKTVPHGQEYLAVPLSLVKEIKQQSFREGKLSSKSHELTSGIFWHPSDDILQDCTPQCAHRLPGRIQQMVKSRGAKQDGAKLEDLYDNGAVLFGRNSIPKDIPPASDLAIPTSNDQNDEDSAIGSSMQLSSISNATASSGVADQTSQETFRTRASQTPDDTSPSPAPVQPMTVQSNDSSSGNRAAVPSKKSTRTMGGLWRTLVTRAKKRNV